jgi:acyl-coenzyme A thioesterase PaaI-like protein
MATAEARVEDEQGKLYAHATTICFVFDVPTG